MHKNYYYEIKQAIAPADWRSSSPINS